MAPAGGSAETGRSSRARRILRLTFRLAAALLFLELGLTLARPAALEVSLAARRAPPPHLLQLDAAEPLFAGQPRRVVHCLGDSAILAGPEASPAAYPAHLQDLLGEVFLVLNLGEEGAGIGQSAGIAAAAAARFAPDLLILLPGCDDPEADRRLQAEQSQGALRRSLRRCGDWLLRHSRLAQFAPLLAGSRREPVAPPGRADADEAQRGALDALAAASAGRLLVVLLEDFAATPALAEHCQTRQIPFLRVPPLRAAGSPARPVLGPEESRRLAQRIHLALMTGEGVSGTWEPLR